MRAHYLATIGEHYTRNQLIFLDESAKDERSLSRLYGYSPRNTPAQKKVVFIREKQYTILPALIIEGFVTIDVFEGSCDRKKFIDFILGQVVPIMNPYPGDNSIIVMDNARIHHDYELIVLLEGLGQCWHLAAAKDFFGQFGQPNWPNGQRPTLAKFWPNDKILIIY